MSTFSDLLRAWEPEAWRDGALVQYPLRVCAPGTRGCLRGDLPDRAPVGSGSGPSSGPSSATHPEVLGQLLLCAFRDPDECEEGSYGKVYQIDGLESSICMREGERIVLKKVRVDEDDMDLQELIPRLRQEGCSLPWDFFHRILNPVHLDALAEPVIQSILNRFCRYPEAACRIRGTMCRDLQWALTADAPMSLYMWMDRIGEDADQYLSADREKPEKPEKPEENEKTQQLLDRLDSFALQLTAAILGMGELGVSHNDLHMANILVAPHDADTVTIPTPFGEAVIPTPDRRKYAIIDFGMATLETDKCTRPEAREAIAQDIQLWTRREPAQDQEPAQEPAQEPQTAQTPQTIQLGGHLIEDFFLTHDPVNADLRTLALDMLVTYLPLLPEIQRRAGPVHRLFETALLWTPRPGAEPVSAIKLLRNSRALKRACRDAGTKMRSRTRDYKNPGNLRGKFHILRELMLHPSASKLQPESVWTNVLHHS